MKQKVIKISALAALATVSLLSAGYMISQSNARTVQEEYVVPAAAETGAYLVKTHNGKVSVYTGGFYDLPAIETEIAVENLRVYDRQLLEKGITVNTYEEVLCLFEDFGP